MLAPWKESYDPPILENRDITMPIKVRLVKAMVFLTLIKIFVLNEATYENGTLQSPL